jgi:hypothetical protein
VANLEVVIPPEISDKHSTADMNINEGSAAKFVCSATGQFETCPHLVCRGC